MLDHVHETSLEAETIEMTPPHAHRRATEAYHKSHHFLVYEQDTPCFVCGVRNSTLKDDHANKFKAKAIETHHWPIEWSMQNACDIHKVHKHFPEVIDQETFHVFIDSPRNLLVLCDQCHRSRERGVHHLLASDFAVMPYLLDTYVLVSDRDHAKLAAAHDEEVIKAEIPGD